MMEQVCGWIRARSEQLQAHSKAERLVLLGATGSAVICHKSDRKENGKEGLF